MAEARPGKVALEVEWQLDALDLRPIERWLAACLSSGSVDSVPGLRITDARARRLVDLYLDTADWRLGRAGYVLRVRRSGARQEATLKDFAAASGGLRRRLEVTQDLDSGGLETMDRGGQVGWRLQALVGARPLQPVLEVRTRRRPYRLDMDGLPAGEICLDETAIAAVDERRRLRLARVEIEVEPALVEAMGPLVERLRRGCGLTPASLSKFEAGMMATGLSVPGPVQLGPLELEGDLSLGELAFRVLRLRLLEMLDHVAGTRLGEDIEALHDMRVATRRMRAALEMFSEVLPVRAGRLHAELGWLASVLGDVRDLDVQLERLELWYAGAAGASRSALDELAQLLRAEHLSARAALLGALDSPRYERLVSGLVAMLVQGPSRRFTAGRAPAVVAVPAVIERRQADAAKAARRARRSGLASDYHRLRIRCKRLRYALEFSSGLYDGELRGFVRALTRLQGTLGEMQDAQVASSRLEAVALGEERVLLATGTIFAMGELAGRYRAEARRLVGDLPPLLGAIDGKQWRRARALLTSRARESAPPPSRVEAALAARRIGQAAAAAAAGPEGPEEPQPAAGEHEPNPASVLRHLAPS